MTDLNFKKLVARRWENMFYDDDKRNNYDSSLNIKLVFFRSGKYEFTTHDYDILFLDKLDKLFIELCNTKPTKKDHIKPIDLINKILHFSDRYHIKIDKDVIKPHIIYNLHNCKRWQ